MSYFVFHLHNKKASQGNICLDVAKNLYLDSQLYLCFFPFDEYIIQSLNMSAIRDYLIMYVLCLLIVPLVIKSEVYNSNCAKEPRNDNCTVKSNSLWVEVDCSGLGLNVSHVSCVTLPLPEKVDCKNITLLDLSDNYITNVSFVNFSKLEILNLTLNPISSYNYNTF